VQVGDGCRAECECRSDLCYFELIIPARQGAVIDVSGRTYLRLRFKGIEFINIFLCPVPHLEGFELRMGMGGQQQDKSRAEEKGRAELTAICGIERSPLQPPPAAAHILTRAALGEEDLGIKVCGHVKDFDIRNDQTAFAFYDRECYGGAEVCPVDTVTQEAATKHPCQALGVTNRVRGSANLLHCQGQCGYYTHPPTAGFNCSLCTSADCCFSNSLYKWSDLELGAGNWEPGDWRSDELSISEHGSRFSANHQARSNLLPAPSADGSLKWTFVMIVLNTMFLSCLVVKGWYAQTRQPSEVKEKNKSKEKTWRRRPDVKLNCEEAEKELRKQCSQKQGRSKNSAICMLAKIVESRSITSSHFKNSVLVKEVQEFLGERTSVINSMNTVFSHCTMNFSFLTSASCFFPACIFPSAAFFTRRRYMARCWEQTALLVLVLFLLLLYNSNAQQSGCAATQGTYESAISTMVCGSLLSSPPTCEVVFSSLPKSTGLSSFFITVEIANSDFLSENEYISAVVLGGQTLGRDYLKYDGADSQCNKMSKILDLAAVPMNTVSSAGDLIVRIEASLGVNSNECDGSYLHARVKLTTCTGKILL